MASIKTQVYPKVLYNIQDKDIIYLLATLGKTKLKCGLIKTLYKDLQRIEFEIFYDQTHLLPAGTITNFEKEIGKAMNNKFNY